MQTTQMLNFLILYKNLLALDLFLIEQCFRLLLLVVFFNIFFFRGREVILYYPSEDASKPSFRLRFFIFYLRFRF